MVFKTTGRGNFRHRALQLPVEQIFEHVQLASSEIREREPPHRGSLSFSTGVPSVGGLQDYSLRADGLPTVTCDSRPVRQSAFLLFPAGRPKRLPIVLCKVRRGVTHARICLPSYWQIHRLRQPELEQRFAGNRKLLPLLGRGDSRSRAGTGEHANSRSLSSSR